jgi:hypothetical protein
MARSFFRVRVGGPGLHGSGHLHVTSTIYAVVTIE